MFIQNENQMIKSITSPINPLIKQISLLSEKSKRRKETGNFIVEGKREISLAIKGGFKPITMVFNPTIVSFNELLALYGNMLFDIEMIEVSNLAYNKIAYREGTEGVITIFASNAKNVNELIFKTDNPLIIIAEAPEKPGNIGALMRTADAAGADAFIIANPNTDIYNPNIIRSSVGTVFTNQVAVGTTSEIIAFLKSKSLKTYCATIDEESISCYKSDFSIPCAIVVGTESTGLSEEWINQADQNIFIPMSGAIDSLNVSVSAAVLLFEAVRQRSS